MHKKTDHHKKFDDCKDSSSTHGNEQYATDAEQALHEELQAGPIVEISAVELAKEKLEQELKDAQTKAQENWDLMLRSKAEIENVRRRAALDVEKAHKFSIESLAKELIDVVDSLEKGLEASGSGVEGNEEIASMWQGMQLTHKLFIDTLEKFGIKEINPLGDAFDPAKHEALLTQETADFPPNSILTVVQKGFSIQERVLRPARVIVAKPIGVEAAEKP